MIDTECTKIKLSKREMKLLNKIKKRSIPYVAEYDTLISFGFAHLTNIEPDGYGDYSIVKNSNVTISEKGLQYLKHRHNPKLPNVISVLTLICFAAQTIIIVITFLLQYYAQ